MVGLMNRNARRLSHRSSKKDVRTSTKWPVTYRFVAMGTLMAYTAFGASRVTLAQSPKNSSSDQTQTSGATTPTRRFEIQAGSLDSAISAFENVTHIHVSFVDDGIRSLASPGVQGVYTDEQALVRLLDDSGVTYRFTAPDAVMLRLAAASSSVNVTADATTITSMPKYDEPLMEVPQTVTVVSQALLQEEGTTTLRDALRNVAGISLAAGEGGAQGDNLTIRGFTARNDIFIDGMRDFGSYYRDPFDLQEVEVLQGPSSVTFGRGSTGGVVNQATKTPGLTQFIAGDVDFGTDLTRRGTIDINEPLPSLGKGAAFRLNLMGDEGNVAGRDVAENRRLGIAPSLALGLGTATRWNFSYFHQNADDNPDYGVPWLFNGPAPVPRHDYYGFKNGNYLRTYDDIGTAKVEHDVNGHATIRDQVRFANYVRDARITEPQLVA